MSVLSENPYTAVLISDPEKVKRVARMMKTVGHPSRLKIVELLLERGKMPVKEIYETVGISQSNASQHLKALEDIEVLQSVREGKNICYSILNPGIQKLLVCVNECAEC